jgi:hypothetical protein
MDGVRQTRNTEKHGERRRFHGRVWIGTGEADGYVK